MSPTWCSRRRSRGRPLAGRSRATAEEERSDGDQDRNGQDASAPHDISPCTVFRLTQPATTHHTYSRCLHSIYGPVPMLSTFQGLSWLCRPTYTNQNRFPGGSPMELVHREMYDTVNCTCSGHSLVE